jgi:hypothetical protein
VLWNFASTNSYPIKIITRKKRKQPEGCVTVSTTHAHFSKDAEGMFLHAGIFPKRLKKGNHG